MIELVKLVWRPVLEIAILTVGIYYAFALIKGTRSAPIVTGFLVLLLGLSLITTVLELTVLRFLLGTFSALFAVAVLVIFQPELRRFLASLGSRWWFSSPHEQRGNIEIIVKAVERLSDMHIGALIAIEQSIQLHEAVESGIVVDCEATPEMLETIFFPNNAIHDGGVILRGGRIAYAACIFPLTQRQDTPASLGTRHRAAIGLSEETDALVIVVSEETGAISHAYKGQLTRGVTLEQLRAFLSSVLVKTGKTQSSFEVLRRWFNERFRPPAPAPVKAKAEKE